MRIFLRMGEKNERERGEEEERERSQERRRYLHLASLEGQTIEALTNSFAAYQLPPAPLHDRKPPNVFFRGKKKYIHICLLLFL